MRRNFLFICLFTFLLSFPNVVLCDHATSLAVHLAKAKESYSNKDYDTAITEACNALYHQKQEASSYYYIASSYEKLNETIPAIISYLRFSECCDMKNKRNAKKKIDTLKLTISEEILQDTINKIPEKKIMKMGYYKGGSLYRIHDYIYDPMGNIIEEKFFKPDYSYDYRLIYSYDLDGNVKETMKFDDRNIRTELETYTYKYGNRVQAIRENNSGRILEKTNYEYDIDNNVKKIMKHNYKGEMTFKISYLYSKGKIYEEVSEDYLKPTGMDSYMAKYIYIEGRLIEKTIDYKIGMSEKVKYEYIGDKLVEEIYYNDKGVHIKSRKYSYMPSGDVQEVKEYKILNQKNYVLTSMVSYKYIVI